MSIDILDTGTKIYLYTPPGIAFQDGASYGQLNLGAIGSELAGQDAAGILKKLENVTMGDVAKGAKTAVGNAYEQIASSTGAIIAGILNESKANRLVMNGSLASAKEMYSYGTKQVMNPYSNTAFNSSQVRSYQFTFKMIASSAQDSRMIRSMVDEIRQAMYPKENGKFILAYPSRFRVKFWTGSSAAGGDRESEYIPAIYDCYVTSLQTTYNATSNVYFEDGSPSEVDISISLQETKVLTANDIAKLEKNKVKSSDQADAQKKTEGAMANIKKGVMGGL